MRLSIARHGQTFENLTQIVQGWAFGTLTEEGLQQAAKLADRLANENFSAIYSSDLDRARRTAVAIAKFHDVEIQFDPALRERNFGVFEGKLVEEVMKQYALEQLYSPDFKVDGGESYAELQKRSSNFFNSLFARHENEDVLVVSHGGPISTYLLDLHNLPLAWNKDYAKFQPHNTALTIINFQTADNFEVELLNCTKHLEQ